MADRTWLEADWQKKSWTSARYWKTVDKSVEGPHALIGYEFTKKFNENPIVVNAVGSHHEDIEMEHPIAALSKLEML
jgi:ribonuclease Y